MIQPQTCEPRGDEEEVDMKALRMFYNNTLSKFSKTIKFSRNVQNF